jgi:DNA-binding YbaB/EbfC family protein
VLSSARQSTIRIQQSTLNSQHSTINITMFDGLKNIANLPNLLAKAREVQEKMKQMQDELAAKQVSADSGGGMVSAVVNGKLQVLKVRIDKTRVDVNDTEMLEDLIVAAINAAQVKAAEMIRQEMQKAAGDMGLPPGVLPG